MAEYVTLLGSEDVARAGYNIKSAASDMYCAASQISEAVSKLQQTLSVPVKMEEQWCEVPSYGLVRYHGAHVMDGALWALVELDTGRLLQFRTMDVRMVR